MYQPSWILCGKLSVVGRTFNKVILLIRKKSLCYLRHPFQLLGKATCVKSPPNFLENASRTAFADFTWLRKNICKQHASCMLCSTMIISKPHPSCFFCHSFTPNKSICRPSLVLWLKPVTPFPSGLWVLRKYSYKDVVYVHLYVRTHKQYQFLIRWAHWRGLLQTCPALSIY